MPGEFDMRRIQEDAARRMREMQSRARPSHRPEGGPSAPRTQGPSRQEAPQPEPGSPEPEQPELEQQQPDPPPPQESPVPAQKGALEALFQDKERTIILALLLLLSGEDGNHELMFALMFLLL